MAKKFEIRNSTAEFLIFTVADKEQGVEVLYKDESIWATQKAIATLFDVDRTVVTKHLKNIFDTCELDKEVVCAKIAHTEFFTNSPSEKILERCLVITVLSTSNNSPIAF